MSIDANGLEISRRGFVTIVEIQRPPHNFFNEATLTALADGLVALSADPSCRAILLCSKGKNFCAGADFGSGTMQGQERERSAAFYRQAVRILDCTKPIIAAVQGAAVGGGLGLACAADFRVGDAQCRLVGNFARLGFHQGFALSVTLPDIVGRQAAMDMLYTGRPVAGEEALKIGLLDRLAPSGKQRDEALAWAEEIAESAPLAVPAIRNTLRRDLATRAYAILEHELEQQSALWPTADCAEGIAATREKRPPVFRAA